MVCKGPPPPPPPQSPPPWAPLGRTFRAARSSGSRPSCFSRRSRSPPAQYSKITHLRTQTTSGPRMGRKHLLGSKMVPVGKIHAKPCKLKGIHSKQTAENKTGVATTMRVTVKTWQRGVPYLVYLKGFPMVCLNPRTEHWMGFSRCLLLGLSGKPPANHHLEGHLRIALSQGSGSKNHCATRIVCQKTIHPWRHLLLGICCWFYVGLQRGVQTYAGVKFGGTALSMLAKGMKESE